MSKSPQSSWDRPISIRFWTLCLLAVVALGATIRVWRLGSMPAALHPDELAGLAGVLDVLHGRAPLHPFFDYRIFYLPLTGVGEYLASRFFGYDAWAYRFPSVLYGLATIVTTVGLTYRLTKDRLAAILAGSISAILPWEITVSRIAWENASMLPFLLGGLWALRAGIEDRSSRLLALAGALLAIDAYSYRAALPDGVVLAGALLAVDVRRASLVGRGLALGVMLFLLLVAPLVAGVVADPAFFWRDARISTFHNGIDATTLARFAHNYLAHFDPGPLFFRGDGNAEHGPPFGVLYLWMVPFIAAGFFAAFRQLGASVGVFLIVWLVVYPVGGAATNDGVPHFLRTLIGAPLAAITCGIGLCATWNSLRAYRHARALLAAFLLVVFASVSQFSQVYFLDYPPAAAEAFHSEYRDLFMFIRAHAGRAERICFQGLDDMNSRALFSYYLSDMPIQIRERIDPGCWAGRSLIATTEPIFAPPGARLLGTTEDYDGTVRYSIFLTK